MSGEGTIIGVSLPMTLSLQVFPYKQWCATASADLTALKLTALVYYQFCVPLTDRCGSRNTLFSLGSWSVYNRNWKLIERSCG